MRYDDRSIGIDCLRAVAILWVVGYHFVELPIFRIGYYGVAPFFIISGYCIAFSARSSASGWDFYARRLGRLLPALIVCGAITMIAKHVFTELVPPGREVPWIGAALAMIALPTVNVFKLKYTLPDWAYWSLVVEFQFYALCAGIMIVGLRRYLLPAVCLWCMVRFALSDHSDVYSNDFFPFFIAGLSIAAYQAGERTTALIGLLVAAVLDLLHLLLGYQQPSMPIVPSRTMVMWIGTALVFVAAQYPAPRWLKPVAFVGLVSYPMYLLHQDLGNMFLTWVGVPYSEALFPRLFRGIVMPAMVIAAGSAVFYAVERPLIGPLTRLLRFRSLSGKAMPQPPLATQASLQAE